MAKYDKDDLWIFTYEIGKARFKDYERHCNNGRFQKGKTSNLNKQSMNRFLNELREEKKIVWGVDEIKGFKYSYVPRNKVDEVKKLQEDRRIAQGLDDLSKEEREKILSKMLYEEQNKILATIGQNGAMLIPKIAEKTGLTELKVEEIIWGPMLFTGTISADKEYQIPAKFRKYSLSVLGLYRALRVDMDNFDVIVDKWGFLHPFVFGRLELFRKYKLDEALKEFISRLHLQCYTAEPNEDTLKRIDNYLIAFIISGYSYKHLYNWFELIHDDREFRERVKTCFKEYVTSFQQSIAAFQHGLDAIDKLSRRKPNWEELGWEESSLISLEKFMQFQSIHWENEQDNP